jgi:uncharacterized circularly permuted ATP-grasp superfamily protein
MPAYGRARLGFHETILAGPRSIPETETAYLCQSIKQRGSIMAAFLNAIYRQFLKASLSGARVAGA